MKTPKINTKVLNLTSDNFAEVSAVLTEEIAKCPSYKVGKKKISTIPMCFDTETTTIMKGKIYYAFMYIYQLQVGNYTIISRVKDYMMTILKDIHYTLADLKCNAYMGIANLKYEWSFMRHDFMDLLNPMTDKGADCKVSVFLDKNQPLSFAMGNITVVDICKMTNSSLAKIGKDYCTTQKLSGELDYSVVRNSKSPLSQQELAYCINDVVVGAEFLAYMHSKYTECNENIPLTATGIPRAIMKKEAYRRDPQTKRFVYQDTLDKIKNGFPTRYKDYEHLMKYLFRGGYTHGNSYYVGDLLIDIEHVDYTSDYPAIMLQKKFPVSFIAIDDKDKRCCEMGLNYLLNREDDLAFYCKATFTNLKATTTHSIESTHKCIDLSNEVVDNGRILSASEMTVMITEQDYSTYKKYYTWDSLKVTDLHIGKKEKLPKYVIMAIVDSYVKKKYNKDHHIPYASEKAILNSCYGCTVQRLCIEDLKEIRGINTVETIKCPFPFRYLDLDDEHNEECFIQAKTNIVRKYGYPNNRKLEKYMVAIYNAYATGKMITKNPVAQNIANEIKDRLQQRAYREQIAGTYGRSAFLSPFYGIWITAYARNRLLDMVFDLETFAMTNGYDPIVVYEDTDSMFLNCHQDSNCWRETKTIIDKYNKETEEYNKKNLAEYGCLVTDENVKNPEELLNDIGLFAWEPTATHFKQLGAKRHLQRFYDKKDEKFVIESTIAGLGKKDFAKKIERFETIQEKFDFFTDNMTFDENETSKLTPVFTYEAYEAEVTDEYGNTETMRERCGQVLTHVSFAMKLASDLAQRLAPRVG